MILKKCSLAGAIGFFTAICLHALFIVNNVSFAIAGIQFQYWMLYAIFPFGEMIGYFVVLSIFSQVRILVEASRFAIVGFFNFVLDVAILTMLSLQFGIYGGVGIVLLNIIAGTIALFNSYYWNRKFTFEKQTEASAGEFGAFVSVSIIGILINTTVLFLITTFLPAPSGLTEEQFLTIAKIASIFVSLFWNFFGYKFIVFKKKTQERIA